MKIVSDNPENVVPLFRKKNRGPDRKHCYHGGQMLIDPDTRLVQCELCEAWLDAFTALEVLTRKWDRHVEATKWAEYKHKEASERVAELKREEIWVKARLRRARKQLDTAQTGPNT